MEAARIHLGLFHRWRFALFLLCLCLGLLSALVFSDVADKFVPNPLRSADLYIFFFPGSSRRNVSQLSPLGLLPSHNNSARGASVSSSDTGNNRLVDDELGKTSVEETRSGTHTNASSFPVEEVHTTNHEPNTIPPAEEPIPLHYTLEVVDIPSPNRTLNASTNESLLSSKNGSFELVSENGDDLSQLLQQPANNPSSGNGPALPSPRYAKALPGQCDISLGRWVQDDAYPLYQPGSCPYVDEGFSCQENGRQDSDYMRWRWKPNDCEIPRFNATKMLERLRGKRLVFVGDSLNRNQWESMLCILREAVADKSRVFEIHGQRITKGKGAFAFKFLDYNCKVEFYRSHFLMLEGKSRRGSSGRSRLILRLDRVDRSEGKWRQADILIFNTGHWWSHGKTAKGKNYFQEGDTLYPKLNVMVAFRKAMNTWAAWVDKNVNPKTTQVFFRGYSPAHFRGGQWDSGGQCHNEREPIFNESYLTSYPEKMPVVEDIIQQMKTPVKILNVTRLSDFRKDAHPSIYGQRPQDGSKAGGYQDCSHWCLPGVPDIWNELLYASLTDYH